MGIMQRLTARTLPYHRNQQLKTMISRQIEGVDKAIDKVVYGLYDLTEDEIKVVEGG
jgi:hypothetical protein